MKNFTKTITNKTLFKPTRWLIMALMLLVGTSSAWAYNQSASKTLYFNASGSELTMNSSYKLIYMVGHSTWSSAYALKPVQYTKNMYTLSTTKWDNCTQVAFFQVKESESWGDEANSITHRKNYAQKSTNVHTLISNISANVYFYGNLSRGSSTDYTNATSSYNITLTNKCDGVDNNEAGTIAVSRWNSTSSTYGTAYSSWLSNSNGSTKYLSALKVTVTPNTGYKLKSLTVGGTSVSSGHEFEVTGATEIIATWELDCVIVKAPNVTPSETSVCSGSTITLTLDDRQDGVTYQVDGATAFSGSTNTYTSVALNANKTFTIVASHEDACDNDIESTVDVTIKSAPTKPVVTLTPADGNIVSGNSATLSVESPVNNVTYTLYEATRGEIETEKTSFAIKEAGAYYVIGTDECGQNSPASDSKTITVCTIGSTLNSAEYDAATQKVSLEGTFEFCGKESFHGFQWKKVGSNWCDENVPTDNSDYVTLGKTTEGGTKSGEYTIEDQNSAYVFRTYVVPVGGEWIYGNVITVTPCINIATPNITAAPICAGSTATLTLNNKQTGVTYTLDDGTPIFTDDDDEYTTPALNRKTTYTITATSTNSCDADQKETANVTVEVNELPEAPVLAKTEETVCPNTQFTLPTIDGKWYAQTEGGSPYGSNTITNGVATTTYYYAEAVKYGCSSASRTKYTVNVHTAPVAPEISLNPRTVGQDKPSVLSISDATYNPSNTKYELYKGNAKVEDMASQTTNVSSSNVGDVIYSVKATHKECADLTSTSNTVTLTVQEAGAIIAALGDLKVDPNDPVDFVAMYVKNDGLADYTDQGATKVKGYTWQFNDGTGWKDCASTNTVAGVDYDVLGMENGSSKCNNFRPNVAGKYRCKVTYDAGEQYSNTLTVTADGSTAKTFKGVTMTLPVISVNTGAGKFPVNDFGGTPSKNATSDKMKAKISVDVKIFDKGAVVYDRKARMNYRGSSSMNFLKKSYAFVTGKEKTKNDKGEVDTGKANLLGVGTAEDKDWVLYAAAADPSLMRNRLMFDTFKAMTGEWGVNSRYVELVVNGEYKGVYVLMDKITSNVNRVNVEWKQDINGKTTQEGFIVKFDKTDIADRYENTSGDQKTFKSTYSGHDGLSTYDTEIDQRFEIEYPEKGDIEEEDLDNNKGAGDWSVVFNSIKDKFNKFEKELKAGNFSEVQKLIDYESWADWFIITEFAKNIDGYRASNFFVYDGSKANAKIEARPLWDQELSFNNQCPGYYNDYEVSDPSELLIKDVEKVYTDNCSAPFWFTGRYTGGRGTYNGSNQTFKGLLDDPCFIAVVKARWDIHTGANGALTSAKLTEKMTGYLKDLDKDHNLASSTIHSGTPLDREFNTFWKNKSRATIDCGTGSDCFGSKPTGYTDPGFHASKSALNNWLVGERRTKLNDIIDNLEGLDLSISVTVTPEGGEITPWEAVMVQVNNPSGYDYDLNYTTNTLDKVEGVIINENNDKYTYRIPRPASWGTGDGERDAIEYGIQAILNVDGENLQCGSSIKDALTKADVTITLKDEEDDNCSIK